MRAKPTAHTAVEYESMLNRIEQEIVSENLSLSSTEVYVLREHIELVRGQIQRFTAPQQTSGASN
jgi:hypothetical protein